MIRSCSRLSILLIVGAALGQIDTERSSPALDNDDLYSRAAASRIVAVGTVIKAEGVAKRMTPVLLEKMKTDASLGTGGRLFTIQSEDMLCRDTDFHPNASSVPEGPQKLAVFIPFDEPSVSNGRYQEILLPGIRYLLFLSEVNVKQKEEWIKLYALDPDRAYYRGEEHNRGVIPLVKSTNENADPKQPEILKRTKQLCEAMHPPNPKEKLASLQKLAVSGDPVLEKEAVIAIQAIHRRMRNETDD